MISDVPPHVSIRLKQIFQKIPKAQTNHFEMHDTAEVCADLEWFMARYPLEMDSDDRGKLAKGRGQFERDRAEVEAIMSAGWTPTPRQGFKPGFKLWHEQSQAIEVWHKKRALIVGDSLGLGKTLTALGTIVGRPDLLPAAILAKTHLPVQWVTQFIKPSTYLSAHIIEGTKPYRLPPANVYIFKYSNIAGWVDVAATGMFRTFIADEVHELRTGTTTDRGKAAKVFADHAVLKGGLSGTPIFNYGDEIFNIIDIFSPGLLGDREEFIREWCTNVGNDKWAVKDPEALGTYLREVQIFLRRTREGRPSNTQVIHVAYDSKAADKSRDLAKQLAITTLTGSFTESGQAARELDALVRLETGVGKAKGVAAFVRILLTQGIPVLLFGWHRSVYQIWLKELADFHPVMFTGSETTAQKEKSRQHYMKKHTNLMILSLRSGDGIDGLQHRGSTIVFGEYDWTPGVHEQCKGRVDRYGQKAAVIDTYYCHVNAGSDPTIISVHGIKASQARGIIDPGKGIQPVFHDENRVKMLAENYLKQIA